MDVKQVISQIKQLPPTPEIMPKLRALLRDGNSSVNEIISLIKLDQSLAAQIVRVSNSAFYGAHTPSHSLEEAVNRIGFNEVYKLVAFVASSHVLSGENKIFGYSDQDLWVQSVTCATIMQHLAQNTGEDSDTAYTIGLMHAIGKVAINAYYASNKLDLPEQRFIEDDLDKERAVFGFNHTEAGAELLSRWKFDDDITLPIRQQFAPHTLNSHRKLAYILYLSKAIQPTMELRPQEIAQGLNAEESTLKEVGLDEDDVICCIMAAKAALHDIKDLIHSV